MKINGCRLQFLKQGKDARLSTQGGDDWTLEVRVAFKGISGGNLMFAKLVRHLWVSDMFTPARGMLGLGRSSPAATPRGNNP